LRTLFDVNVLIALFDPGHVHHERAHEWWGLNRKGGWASCPITQNGFVRILSQPRYPNTVTTLTAMRLLQSATMREGHVFWPDDISLVDEKIFDSKRILGPKQLTDIYLFALAVKNRGRLATFDATIPLTAVCGAELERMVVI
jgi:uncharacterized protein